MVKLYGNGSLDQSNGVAVWLSPVLTPLHGYSVYLCGVYFH